MVNPSVPQSTFTYCYSPSDIGGVMEDTEDELSPTSLEAFAEKAANTAANARGSPEPWVVPRPLAFGSATRQQHRRSRASFASSHEEEEVESDWVDENNENSRLDATVDSLDSRSSCCSPAEAPPHTCVVASPKRSVRFDWFVEAEASPSDVSSGSASATSGGNSAEFGTPREALREPFGAISLNALAPAAPESPKTPKTPKTPGSAEKASRMRFTWRSMTDFPEEAHQQPLPQAAH